MHLLFSLAALAGPEDDAARFAPVLYQDVADGLWNTPERRRWDLIAAVDFDGNTDPYDNVENLRSGDHPLRPVVYWDHVESGTHLFLLYSFFHPVDWNELDLIDHENDLESIWVVVEKQADGGRRVVAVHAQAHGELLAWTDGSLAGDFPIESGGLALDGERPRIFIEAHGHGPASCSHPGGLPYTQPIDCDPPASEDLMVYRPLPDAVPEDLEEPDVAAGGRMEAHYALVDAHTALWPLRTSEQVWSREFVWVPSRNRNAEEWDDLPVDPFAARLRFDMAGDEGGGAGTPPWGIESNDRPLFFGTVWGAQGDILLDPAQHFAELYAGQGCLDRTAYWNYLHHPYLDDVLLDGEPVPWSGVDDGERCDGWEALPPAPTELPDTGTGPLAETDARPDARGCSSAAAPGRSGWAGVWSALTRRR